MAYYWNNNGDVMDREIRRKESTTFFKNLKVLAEKNGLNNVELANILGIQPTYIYKYFSGKTVPREEKFEEMKKSVLDFFDITITDMLDEDFDRIYEETTIVEPIDPLTGQHICVNNEKISELTKEVEKVESTARTEMTSAINKRKEQVARLTKEIEALEQALTLIMADELS